MPTAPLRPVYDQNRLIALYEVTRALGSSLNLDESLVVVVDSAIRLTNAERGFLMLPDEHHEFVFRVARNAKQNDLPEEQFEISRSVLQEVAQSGTPVVSTNAQKDPRFSQQKSVVHFSLRSVMAVPLKVRGHVAGVLYVDNKARDALFTQNDLDLLYAFARQAAIAVENARLYTQTDQALAARVAELQTLQAIDRQINASLDFDQVMALTLGWAVKRTDAQTGWIGLVEDDGVRLATDPGKGDLLPRDHPLLEAVLRTGELQRPAGAGSMLSRLVTPVVRDGRTVAVIAVERPGPPFNPAHAEFLSRLADRAAAAIENARLYDQVKTANEAKSKFVSIVSHELKIPMTSIKGYADLLLTGMTGPLTDQQKQFLVTVRTNVERMAVLVSDLSDISRIETGRLKIDLKAVDVAAAVREAVDGLLAQIEAKGQRLTLDLPPDLPRARTDHSRLVQILANLISNAHKYTPEGGDLSVKAAAEKPFIKIQVIDNGLGLTPAEQTKLFSQFFRSERSEVRQETGWGLGLHITKRLIELLGGEIDVDSAEGHGSTFAFTVPIDG